MKISLFLIYLQQYHRQHDTRALVKRCCFEKSTDTHCTVNRHTTPLAVVSQGQPPKVPLQLIIHWLLYSSLILFPFYSLLVGVILSGFLSFCSVVDICLKLHSTEQKSSFVISSLFPEFVNCRFNSGMVYRKKICSGTRTYRQKLKNLLILNSVVAYLDKSSK